MSSRNSQRLCPGYNGQLFLSCLTVSFWLGGSPLESAPVHSRVGASVAVVKAIDPLGILAILVGLVIVAVVAIVLVGGITWLLLRNKAKEPAKGQASAAVGSRPPVQTPLGPIAQPPVESPSPAYAPAPPPAQPLETPPERSKRPQRAAIEIVEKEQKRVAQELSGGVKDWKTLFMDSFQRGALESPGLAEEKPAIQKISPERQVLVDTINNTAKDVSSSLARLAGTDNQSWQTRLPGSPFLDQFVDLARRLSWLVNEDLVALLGDTEKQRELFTLDPRTPLVVRSLKGSTPSGQAISTSILEGRPASHGAIISLSRTAQLVTLARETVEMAYREVLNSLGNDRTTAGHTTLARGFDTAKEVLSGGSR